jgi:hypothetical protein
MKPICQYVNADGVKVTVLPEKKTKRATWCKNDTFYSAKMRITDDSMFAPMTRKKGKG